MATWNKDNVVIPVVSTSLPSAVKIVREDLSYPGDAVSCTQTTKSISRWIPDSNLDTEYEYVVYADDIEIGRIRGSDATEIFRHDVAIYGDLSVSGTIISGTWNGTAIDGAYIDMTHAELDSVLGSGEYHLSSFEHTELTEWMDDVTLSDGGEVDLSNNYITSFQNTADAGAGIVGNYYSFDGVDDYGEIADDDNLDFGTGDFSITWSCYIPDFTPTVEQFFIFKRASGKGYLVYLGTGGKLNLGFEFGIIANWDLSSLDGGNYVFSITIDRDSDAELFVNGVSVGCKDISAYASTDLNNTCALYLGTNGTLHSAFRLYYLLLYNHILTADEVKALYSGAPVPFKYQGASQTELVTNWDFSNGNITDGWSASGTLETAEYVASYGGESDCLHMVESGTDYNGAITESISFNIGKLYKREVKIYVVSASGSDDVRVGSYNIWEEGYTFNYYGSGNTGAWITETEYLVANSASSTGAINIQIRNNAEVYVSYGSVKQIGNVLNLNKSKTTDIWYDESGNNLDATMHGATLVSNNKYGYFERGLKTGGNLSVSGTSTLTGDITTDGEIKVNGTGDSYVMGNLGVGTNSPSQALEVNGHLLLTDRGQQIQFLSSSVRLERPSGQDYLYGKGSTGIYFDTGSTGVYNFKINTNTVFKIANNGNLLVGTVTDVAGKLQVSGDIKQEVHTSNVSNPPTDAELDALFTSPSSKGEGWTAYVKDSDTDSMYQITSDGTNWQVLTMTPADTASSSSTAISNIALTENNEFPANMVLIRNEELNNTLSTSTGTPITVSSIDTGANTITLSWLPYIPSIWSPGSGRKWGLINLENTTGSSDPAIDGDYDEIFIIDSGTYSTKTLNYTVANGADTNWSVGDKVALYNPYRSNIEFYDSNPVFLKGSGIYSVYANPGGGFYHSDGYYVLLVNGSTGTNVGTVGAYKSDGVDWTSWSQINSGATIFTTSGTASNWREDKLVNANVIKLPTEDRYIGYFSGYSSTDSKWRIGYAKFDEDFSSGSIEYSSGEIIDSSSSSNGLQLGSVIYYGGKWRMIYIDRAAGTVTDWEVKEAFSDAPEGDFTYSGTIVSSGSTNDGVYYSSHLDGAYYFMWKGRLYAWIAGTSRYLASGTRADRIFGLWYLDELSGTDTWVEVKYNPVFMNPIQGNHVWSGVDDWMADHMGRNISMALNNYDGKLYIFFNAGSGTDTYQGGIATMDLPSLLEHY